MKTKLGIAFISALFLCAVTATAVSALIIFSEVVEPFQCGSGATTDTITLPPGDTEFGIARTSLAILARVEANSNSTAGYVGKIALGRGAKAASVDTVTIYFNPQGAPLSDLNVFVEYRYQTANQSGFPQVRTVIRNARFSNLQPPQTGTDGWESVNINLGVNQPAEVAELLVRVYLQNGSNRDESVKFGKIELSPISGAFPAYYIVAPRGCN